MKDLALRLHVAMGTCFQRVRYARRATTQTFGSRMLPVCLPAVYRASMQDAKVGGVDAGVVDSGPLPGDAANSCSGEELDFDK